MGDAQFELELGRQRQEAESLRRRVAQRAQAEAGVLAGLEATCARDERDATVATEAAAADEQEHTRLQEHLRALDAGLTRSRRFWVRLGEPWLLSTLLFAGFLSIGLAPKPGDAVRATALATLGAAAVGVTFAWARGTRRGR